jgi:hypothetical protein
MSQYKLAVAAFLAIPMIFDLADADKTKSFNFTLQAKRLGEDEFQTRIKGENGLPTNEKIKELLLDITTGWKDQTLVLDEQEQPAAFCREALEVMFQTPGVLDIATRSYLKEVAARAKN